MAGKCKIGYSVKTESRVVCVPPRGFPLERLRDYVGRCVELRTFMPDELLDLIQLLCDDELIGKLDERGRLLVMNEIRPTVNEILQRKARELRAGHLPSPPCAVN